MVNASFLLKKRNWNC